jgi:hypothetical protein
MIEQTANASRSTCGYEGGPVGTDGAHHQESVDRAAGKVHGRGVSFLAQEEICSAEEVLDATSKRDELIAEIAPPQSYSVFKYCATVFERSANYRLIALRDRVVTVVDPAIREDQVRITIALKDGRRLEKFIEHAIGSVEKPMSDAALEAKFTDLAAGILPPDQIRRLMDLCWNIDDLHAAAEVAKAATA